MAIYTENMMKDLYQAVDDADRLSESLIPFAPGEKSLKMDKKMNKIQSKYKTLDIEDYTINKQ